MFRWEDFESTQLDKHYTLEVLEPSLCIGRLRDFLPFLGSIPEDRRGKTMTHLVIDKIQEGRGCRTWHPFRAECNQTDSVYNLLRALD